MKSNAAQKNIEEESRAEQVLSVIITDSYGHASRECSTKTVKKLIEEQKKEGWEFIFPGANIDAVEAAGYLGIDEKKASNYCSDHQGLS